MAKLTHTNEQGKAQIVDIGSKLIQQRKAKAKGFIKLQPKTIKLILENELMKGDVISVSRIAGIQAAKRTSELIPLCHPLLLTNIILDIELLENGALVTCETQCNGQTGVEMEALTAVQLSLLSIYDMCKSQDKEMVIEEVKLISKSKK